MKLGLAARALVVLALCVTPLRAGTLYIPLAIDTTRGGLRFHTEAFVANQGTEREGFDPYFIETNTNGTQRSGAQGTVFVDPGKTVFFSSLGVQVEGIGMLEMDAEPHLAVHARLAVAHPQNGNLLGAAMPVVTDKNQVAAGVASQLVGLERTTAHQTDLGLVNLENRNLICNLTLYRGDGTVLFGPWTNLTVPPRGHRYFEDALADMAAEINGVRAAISCDGRNFPFAVILGLVRGDVLFLSPAGSNSTLSLPGATPTPTPPTVNPTPTTPGQNHPGPTPAPGQSFVFTEDGLFHEPTMANPVRRFVFPFRPGIAYKAITVDMDVHFGGYFRAYPEGIHNFLWLARNQYRSNTFGYVNVRGGGRNLFYNMTNAGLPEKALQRGQVNARLIDGHDYHLAWTYHIGSGKITAVLTDLTEPGIEFRTTQNTTLNRIVTEGNGFILDVGLRLVHDDVPSIGWKYRDLRVEFYPP